MTTYRFRAEPHYLYSEGIGVPDDHHIELRWSCPHAPYWTILNIARTAEWEDTFYRPLILGGMWQELQHGCVLCAALPMPAIGDMAVV